MDYIKVGEVVDYLKGVRIIIVQILNDEINVGDMIRIGEFESGMEQKIKSMQINGKDAETGKLDDEVSLKVTVPVKPGTFVYKVIDKQN